MRQGDSACQKRQERQQTQALGKKLLAGVTQSEFEHGAVTSKSQLSRFWSGACTHFTAALLDVNQNCNIQQRFRVTHRLSNFTHSARHIQNDKYLQFLYCRKRYWCNSSSEHHVNSKIRGRFCANHFWSWEMPAYSTAHFFGRSRTCFDEAIWVSEKSISMNAFCIDMVFLALQGKKNFLISFGPFAGANCSTGPLFFKTSRSCWVANVE